LTGSGDDLAVDGCAALVALLPQDGTHRSCRFVAVSMNAMDPEVDA
jgi:hypothetical protein